jgi:cytidine deaminase
MPCGACRQIMAEYLAPEADVLVDGVGKLELAELLPRPFRLEPPV